MGDFNAILSQFNYRNYEIYNLAETGVFLTKLYFLKFSQLKELKKMHNKIKSKEN